MTITKEQINKQALGRMVVYMEKGHKTTESVFCARADAVRKYSEILQINGNEAVLKRVVYNGVQIYPEIIEMDTKQLCEYLPESPAQGTIRNWIFQKTIPFHKAGSSKNSPTYFIKSEIDKWIENGRK